MEATAFGVRLVQPVDRYLMTERAMKYGLVVLVLVFGSVFLVEVLQKRSLHLIQYGLVGLALAVFFLLLLSLAEHLGFGLAYLLAASACSALVAVYLAGALASRGGGWLALGGLGALYGLLYLLLRSQDHALLLGSLLLFALLAALMLGTRRMRWQGMAPGVMLAATARAGYNFGLPATPGAPTRCSPRTARSPATTPNWPRPSRTNASGRRTTSS